ncbi:MAG TPA: TonB family protein [Bryobacteraceae bacterium]|nr:TonB family protein [Bryobacteraceae bacterium]
MKSWREPLTSRRLLRAGIGSVIVHIAVAAFFILMPEQSFDRVAPIIVTNLRRPVKLYLPPDLQLTQRDPNQGQPAKMVDVHSMHVSPRPQMANSRPSPPPGAPAPAPVTPPAPQPVRVAGIELPKIETPKIDVPAAPPALSAAAPKSDSKPTERPKIAFEDVTPGQRASQNAQILPRPLPPPTQAAQESLRNPPQPAGASGAGTVASSNAASQELREMSPPQLLSDPRGVDFKPYMIQVLSVVRRNWLAILPESARAGRRGRVIIQFAIDRTGAVPKVVIAEGTGTDALDRAAVAAISASVPLPPLPADYKGDKISLQFAFSYNMPAR